MSTAAQHSRNGQHPSPAKPAPAPPASIEAEQSVLGAMLIEAVAVEKARAVLSQADFSRDGHRTLFETVTALTDKGKPVDLITVQAALQDKGSLDAIGGLTYLTGLFDIVPTAASVEHYARIVADKAQQRRVWEWAQRAADAASGDVADVGKFTEQIQADLERITQKKPGAGASARPKPFAQRIISLRSVPDPPLELPYLFGPYLNEGAAHWLTGQTGIGKSTLLYNLLPALAEGRELWGVPSVPRRILYMDMESGDVGRSLKAQRLFQDRAEREGLANLRFLREAARLPEELPALLAYAQAEGISLVVFDTARRCFTVKDENDNAEVYNRVVPTLDALKAVGVATLTMGHPPKNGIMGARGAGAQEDAGDVNLTLTMHRGEVSDADGIIALRVTKNRLLGLNIPPLYLRRIGEDQFERMDAGEAGAGETITQRMKCREFILEFLGELPDGQARHGDLWKAAQADGFGKGTFDRTLREMKAERDVHSPAAGLYALQDPFAGEAGN